MPLDVALVGQQQPEEHNAGRLVVNAGHRVSRVQGKQGPLTAIHRPHCCMSAGPRRAAHGTAGAAAPVAAGPWRV